MRIYTWILLIRLLCGLFAYSAHSVADIAGIYCRYWKNKFFCAYSFWISLSQNFDKAFWETHRALVQIFTGLFHSCRYADIDVYFLGFCGRLDVDWARMRIRFFCRCIGSFADILALLQIFTGLFDRWRYADIKVDSQGSLADVHMGWLRSVGSIKF